METPTETDTIEVEITKELFKGLSGDVTTAARAHAVVAEYNAKWNAIGSGARFQPMPDRMQGLIEEVRSRHARLIPTGIKYLDDVSGGGIGPSDLWILSATTGSGKTAAMLEIAKTAAKAGKRVAFFALEADHREMEARILLSALVTHFAKANPGVQIDRAKWYRGDPATHALLAPYEAAATADATEGLALLEDMYLGYGKYTVKELEKDVIARSKDCDLIVIDHLGYVSLDGENENKETTDLLFLLRDLVKLDRCVPIITACHTRKSNAPRKFAPLLPGREDIKGSNSIITCATAVVMLSKVREPVFDFNGKEVRYPTIIQMQKDRRDGRDYYAAICNYSTVTGTYVDAYGLGRMTKGDTGWLPVDVKGDPRVSVWAQHATTILRPFGAEGPKENK